MAAYFDIAGMLQKSSSGDSAAMKSLEAARSTFKNFIAFTEKGDGKTTKSRLELNTVNSSENSLASIARFIAIAHEEGMKHRNNFEIHPPFGTDSIPGMPNVPEEKDTE